jgi:KDO2-lipid IV(A) lauroyltransferase
LTRAEASQAGVPVGADAEEGVASGGGARSSGLAAAAARARDAVAFTLIRSALLPAQVAGVNGSREVARAMGRAVGGAFFNAGRVRKAADRMAVAFPELGEDARHGLALRAYEHLFQLGAEFALAPRLITQDGWSAHVELGNVPARLRELVRDGPVILVTGHCGNWEIVAYTLALLGFRMHGVYRPLDLKPLDQWVRATRAARGLELVDKFGAARRVPELLAAGEIVAFVADQNAGDRGLQVPFFNRLASTYKSIGLVALQHRAPVIVGQARRLPEGERRGGMGYRLEIVDTIRPEDWSGQPDPLYYVTARFRRGIEQMVRASPEQYLWMHRIWKSRPRHERLNEAFPASLRGKLEALPWLDGESVGALVERSELDRAWLAAHGTDRLP